SGPTSQISVLDDPGPHARGFDPQSEAREFIVAIQRVAIDQLQCVHKSLGELGHSSLRKGRADGSSWPGTHRGHGREKIQEISRSFRGLLNMANILAFSSLIHGG